MYISNNYVDIDTNYETMCFGNLMYPQQPQSQSSLLYSNNHLVNLNSENHQIDLEDVNPSLKVTIKPSTSSNRCTSSSSLSSSSSSSSSLSSSSISSTISIVNQILDTYQPSKSLELPIPSSPPSADLFNQNETDFFRPLFIDNSLESTPNESPIINYNNHPVTLTGSSISVQQLSNHNNSSRSSNFRSTALIDSSSTHHSKSIHKNNNPSTVTIKEETIDLQSPELIDINEIDIKTNHWTSNDPLPIFKSLNWSSHCNDGFQSNIYSTGEFSDPLVSLSSPISATPLNTIDHDDNNKIKLNCESKHLTDQNVHSSLQSPSTQQSSSTTINTTNTNLHCNNNSNSGLQVKLPSSLDNLGQLRTISLDERLESPTRNTILNSLINSSNDEILTNTNSETVYCHWENCYTILNSLDSLVS